MNEKNRREYYRGCLLGGSIGDALGFAIEFSSYWEIKRTYGSDGLQTMVLDHKGKGLISDDTQMMLFTIEGLMNAERDQTDHKTALYEAYLRWLYTQGYTIDERLMTGSLIYQRELIARRAPGNTCLSALASGRMGGKNIRLNDSKGNGAVMRTAPIGLYYAGNSKKAFRLGADAGSITHSHPTGFYAAGAMAAIISEIIGGSSIEAAVDTALGLLNDHASTEETITALEKAKRLGLNFQVEDVDAIGILGEGWIAEEALAIGIYCALRHQTDFRQGLLAAVNHGGDSDSTGMITGNILGAYLGEMEIPFDWILNVEFGKITAALAEELFCVRN